MLAKEADAIVICDLMGCRYSFPTHVLLAFPCTRLARIVQTVSIEEITALCDHVAQENGRIVLHFNRSADLFVHIAAFYCTGTVHVQSSVATQTFIEELTFWRIDLNYIGLCCKDKLSFSQDSANENAHLLDHDCCFSSPVQTFRQKLWTITENSPPSTAGKIYFTFTFAVLICYIVLQILYSFPAFQPPKVNGTFLDLLPSTLDELELRVFVVDKLLIPYELVLLWFLIELGLRFYGAPKRLELFKDPLTVMNIVSITLLIVQEIMFFSGHQMLADYGFARYLYASLGCMRMLHVLHFARQSQSLRIMYATLVDARAELAFLVQMLGLVVLILGTLMWAAEVGTENSPFQNILAGMYWCIVTVTTVGYGDYVPTTPGGKIIASLTTVVGIILMAMPISILVTKFTTAYSNIAANAKKQAIKNTSKY